MATIEEQQKLIDILKFTPCTYRISLWGYGGEVAMGTVNRKIYDYFKHRRISVSDFAWDYDAVEELNIPEEFWPFSPGSWYECDDMGHASGVERDSGTLQITDDKDNVVFERSLDDFDEEGPEWVCGDEAWIGQEPPGSVVFIGRSNEKGTFFEGEINLTTPFDITKLTLCYDEIDGSEIISSVMYDGEDIENYGGSTDGKSSDFGFFLVKENNTGWETYRSMDDIEYPLTEWFPKKIKPVREGNYLVKTAGKNSYQYHAKWIGNKWVSAWCDEADYNDPDKEIKIKQWRGITHDPDAVEFDHNWDPAEELDKICDIAKEEEMAQAMRELKADPNAKWPF